MAAWTHFATVHAGNPQLVYINDIMANADNLGSPTEGGPGVLYVGNDGFYAPLNGHMDDLRIYSRALTAKQIFADVQ
ncbi:MAG: LamG domain-containing protein [Deltaproteobacteria bacterium]|nr:LamG domain-containing protein [Deltaproteobacteria bacterium]